MGLFRKAAVAGIAKKVFTEAKKPHNQAKVKQLVAKARGNKTGNPAPGGSRAGKPGPGAAGSSKPGPGGSSRPS
jgi:hypothetical protein